jgi:ATP-binding cassette subfamily B multidrug efflux pump
MTSAPWGLLAYLLKVRRSLLLGQLAVLAATVSAVVSPWLLKLVIDGLTVEETTRRQLALYAAAILAAAIADGWLRYEMRRLFFTASRHVEADVRQDLFAHFSRLPPSFYQSARVGALMAQVSDSIAAVRAMLGQGVMHASNMVLGLTIALSAMLWLDTRLTLIALLPFPFVFVAARRLGRAAELHFEERQVQSAEVSAILQESLTSIRLIKAFGLEDAAQARFDAANERHAACSQRLVDAQTTSYASLRFAFLLSSALVLWVGGFDVINGRLTLGDLVVFNRYQALLAWPVTASGWIVNILRYGANSWRRLQRMFETPADTSESEWRRTGAARAAAASVSAASAAAGGTRVESRGLSFRYSDARHDAITDVSFTVSAGETLAVVGPTGSGKTTLVHLMCGVLRPREGMLFVDGVDITTLCPDDMRRSISVVPQQPFIFGGTIATNIGFGTSRETSSEVARTRIEESAEIMQLTGEIAELPGGHDTIVGERGVTLSGGQRQRLALARALCADAPILLLDDALSEVDSETESRILSRLRTAAASRIRIIVAHRIATTRTADRILVLDRGRIVQQGTHAELCARDGPYGDMYHRQSIEHELSRM